MTPGFTFKNDTMTLTTLCFHESGKRNIALLLRHGDGMFITVRNVSKDPDDNYTWDWGFYSPELQEALDNYRERLTSL